MRSDSELIGQYVEDGSESAFAELVERHLAFVYASALRVTVDPHLAEDITQTTFTLLARRARDLNERATLAGWLHRTAMNQAAKLVRGEMRRRAREQKACAVQTTPSEPEPDWDQIAPIVDDAINRLAETDRTALFLRFFENRTAAQIGVALQIGAEAAQKRVSRALEKLRASLATRGIALSTAALASSLSAQSAVSIPAGLAGAVTTAAMAGSAATTGLAVFHWIFMSKAKTTAVAALLCAGVATPLVLQHQNLSRLRLESSGLREQAGAAGASRSALEKELGEARAAQKLTRAQLAELMRLRGEVGPLRRESQELARLRSTDELARPREGDAPAPRGFIPAAAWANLGADNPESAIETFFWAGKHRETNLVSNLLRWKRDPDIPASGDLDQTFESGMIAGVTRFAGELQGFRLLSRGEIQNGEVQLGVEITGQDGKAQTNQLRFVQEDSQWFPVMHVWLHEKESVRAAMDTPAKFLAGQ